ncbi:hypothetical protein JCM10207_007781 [Rhodosporidiobolus poonsookiae]
MAELHQPTPIHPPPVATLHHGEATPKMRPSSNFTAAPSPLPLELEYVVIGGGTGCNAIVSAFQGAKTTYVVPVSDDGGSTSEIQRVLGGPALGDLRSRLIRLIPLSPPNSPLDCIRRLLEYRLPGGNVSSREVKGEWGEIVEGSHRLWRGFDFKKASIGNLFLSGASLFLGSVPSAVFLFASLTSIDLSTLSVLPVINTSSTVTIAAELRNGRIIAGQSEISHPSPSSLFAASAAASAANGQRLEVGREGGGGGAGQGYFPLTRATTPSFPDPPILGAEEDDDLSRSLSPASPDPSYPSSSFSDIDGDGSGDGSISLDVPPLPPSLASPNPAAGPAKVRNLEFSKDASAVPALESRIKRVFYLNAYGNEIWPRPDGRVVEALGRGGCLIYAPGSLYTSILPCLELRPLGRLISRRSASSLPSSSSSLPSSSLPAVRPLRYKILLLNSRHDRETPAYDALDFVRAITDACARSATADGEEGQVEPRDVVSHVVWLRGGDVQVDEAALRSLGIVPVACGPTQNGLFDDEVVREAMGRVFAGEA